MAVWRVWSMSVNLEKLPQGKRLTKGAVVAAINREVRYEDIDTTENMLFRRVSTAQEVEITYETFWNWLDGPNNVRNLQEKVKVLHVKKLDPPRK